MVPKLLPRGENLKSCIANKAMGLLLATLLLKVANVYVGLISDKKSIKYKDDSVHLNKALNKYIN